MRKDDGRTRVNLKRITEIAVVGWVIFSPMFSVVGQVPEVFNARLTMMPIDLVTRVDVTGSGSSSAELNGERLFVRGSFSGLRGPATVVRLHEGAAMGVRGDAIFELSVEASVNGTFSGNVELTQEQVQRLRQGRLYIQIHSEAAPEGNLWGWLLE
ncbi:MAG: CHRD domain-containing protein [Pseudomonadota bacterium]|jgi:hypothetical protein|nr:CHRD domain-containing protein [Pseudomonadota bacterium]